MIHTSACDLLGIELPVVQAGMASIYTNAELVAAVSNAGGLGILGGLGRTAGEVVSEVRRIRALTDKPFGVNFVLHLLDEAAFRACLDERVPVLSFYRGDPAEVVAAARDAGAITMHQITTVAEAEQALAAGVDVLMAQGCEAGGHMGPVPLLSLLPEVVRMAGSTPVLAAGGIVDGRGLAAALCLGAAGVAMGTRFLATPESSAPPTHKRMILEAGAGDTVASGMWDVIWGREWAGTEVRAIRNELTARWAGREDELRTVVDAVRAEWEQASAADDTSRMCFPVGAGVGQIREVAAAGKIVREVAADAEAILRGMSAILR